MITNIKPFIVKNAKEPIKANLTNIPSYLRKFRAISNKVISMIQESKETLNESIENKLNSTTLTLRDGWSTLKSVISPTNSFFITPFENNGQIYTENHEKANHLNYFQELTLIRDDDVNVPDVANYDIVSDLSSIMLTPAEIEVVLKSLFVGKAVGPDGMSIKILCELSVQLSLPFCLYSTSVYRQMCFRITGRYQMFVPSLSQGITILYQTIYLFLFYAHLRRYLKELFLSTFTIISKIMIFSLLFNLHSFEETQLLINLPICMTFFNRLVILTGGKSSLL